MQCVQRIAQFEKMFQNSSDFLDFIEDTLADEQMEEGDALSIYSCDDLSNSGVGDLDKSFYSFNAFINLRSSKSRLDNLDVEDENDFEILSVNATEFINGFENLSSIGNSSVNGTFLSNKSFKNSGQSCSQVIDSKKAGITSLEEKEGDKRMMRNNLKVEHEEKTGLRKLKRVKTMKKVRHLDLTRL